MSLQPGTRLGPYEVVAQIGVGGMGEVYRATDTKLKRQVAIKVLPTSLAADPDRLARFQREAEVLASLNHPNIAGIYGLEDADGVKALVMELVEGPTLADRIAQGALPIDEALPIAKQIAEALEAAHEQGIIHRDLKPANIKVRPDGTVKVLDFGLAKAMEPAAGSSPSLSMSPTITSPAMMTGAGMILGTAAYMSPEQAKGRTVDRRADVWAFGAVLFEMLTGTRAFEGDGISETLARVIEREPAWNTLPSRLSPVLRTYLGRCLQKDPRQRIRDIGDVRLALEGAFETNPSSASSELARMRSWKPVLALAAVATIVAAGVASWAQLRPELPAVVSRTLVTDERSTFKASGLDRDVAVSRDGRVLAFVGGTAAQPAIMVRNLDQLDPVSLPTEGLPRGLFFSPDGQWIGFFVDAGQSNRVLRKVRIGGGPSIVLARLQGTTRGGTWMDDGFIVFADRGNTGLGLSRVSSVGGTVEVLTRSQVTEGDHLWPEAIPGRNAVLFTKVPPSGQIQGAKIAVLDLDTRTSHDVLPEGTDGHYLASGHLAYGVQGSLRVVPFDVNRLTATGAPVTVVPDLMMSASGAAAFDVSTDGSLVYERGGITGGARSLVWVDRQGREEPIKAPVRAYTEAHLSPDGTRAALDVRDQDNDIWVWDFQREILSRLTFSQGSDTNPVWTPDGTRIAYSSGVPGEIMIQAADGSGSPQSFKSDRKSLLRPKVFTPNGRELVVQDQSDGTNNDLTLMRLDGSVPLRPLLHSTSAEDNADLSPDGRWIAYQADDSGRVEIYVRPFPDLEGGRWQLSNLGGTQPVWARNGKELFFFDLSGRLSSVEVHAAETFTAGKPQTLFETGTYYRGAGGRAYDVRSGRFLLIKAVETTGDAGARSSVVLVQNWFEELKRLVPTN